MILASFSLDWFMTIPGMLITGGVIFLIIALVIFIITGNKKTKTNKEVVAAQDSSKQEAAVVATPAVGQAVTTSEPVVTPQSVVTSESVVPTPPVSSMAEKVAPKEAEPAVFTAPIPQNVAPVPPQPVVNNQVPNIAEQSATVPTTPVVNQPVVTEVPVKEEQKETIQTSSFDMPRPIYGGASPIVPNVPHEEEHRPIYGGANPLENTQSVPIVSQRPVVTEEVKVSVPTVEIPTVQVTPNVTPTVAPQATNDIFASNSVAATPVAPQAVKPTVAVQPAVSQSQPAVSQSQPEEIESLF